MRQILTVSACLLLQSVLVKLWQLVESSLQRPEKPEITAPQLCLQTCAVKCSPASILIFVDRKREKRWH